LSLFRWRRVEYAFVLLWLLVGISPAFVTLPPASLSHTILAQPVVYVFPAVALVRIADCKSQIANRKSQIAHHAPRFTFYVLRFTFILALSFLLTGAVRDVRDYFVVWPERGMVRFLYRADYREAARYVNERPEIEDLAVGSMVMGPWDRLALADDLRRADVRVRLFNPERALLLPAGPAPLILLTDSPQPDPALVGLLAEPAWETGSLAWYRPTEALLPAGSGPAVVFTDGFELSSVAWPDGPPAPGGEARVWLSWRVAAPLELLPTPIISFPPPPGVYAGPRLAVFTHLFAADGAFLAGDDGLWVDPTTLRPGDRFVQLHRFSLPADAVPGPYLLEIGLYDPLSGERWRTVDGEDRVSRQVDE
jgi:hypothetical protein